MSRPYLRTVSEMLLLREINPKLKSAMKSKPIKILSTLAIIAGFLGSASAQVIENFDNQLTSTFTTDFGDVSYVSDLSNGGLRLQLRPGDNTQGALVHSETINVGGFSELLFDWWVDASVNSTANSFYEIVQGGIIGPRIMFHEVPGIGDSLGTVSHFLNQGDYVLNIGTSVKNDPYTLTIDNVRLDPFEEQASQQLLDGPTNDVPDSSLGFLGVATIIGMIGAHRRFGSKKAEA